MVRRSGRQRGGESSGSAQAERLRLVDLLRDCKLGEKALLLHLRRGVNLTSVVVSRSAFVARLLDTAMNEADDFLLLCAGIPAAGLKNFTREKDEFGRDINRWTLQMDALSSELAAYVSKPLPDAALSLYIAAPPFESYHYLGDANAAPSAVFKTRYVWSAAMRCLASWMGLSAKHGRRWLSDRRSAYPMMSIEVVKIARSIRGTSTPL